jgi:hypothetical protein
MKPLLAVATAALATAILAASPAGAARKCTAKKEAAGCKLPASAYFEGGKAGSNKYAFLMVSTGGRLQGTVPLACTGGAPGSSPGGTGLFPVDGALNLPKKLVVGKTYNKRWQFDEVSPDGRTHSIGDYSWSLTVSSGKKVKASFSSKLTQDSAVPDELVDNPPRVCEGSSKHTLKRIR